MSVRHARRDESGSVGDVVREERGGQRDDRSSREENERRAELSALTAEEVVVQLRPGAVIFVVNHQLSPEIRWTHDTCEDGIEQHHAGSTLLTWWGCRVGVRL